MKNDIQMLIEKHKTDVEFLDALYQWITNPTGSTAINRHHCYPNHDLIKNNLEIRYSGEKQVENVYNTLIEELKSIQLNFSTEHPGVEIDMEKYLEENDILRKTIIEKLKTAPDNEKYIIWFYCKTKDNIFEYELSSHFSTNWRETSSWDVFSSFIKSTFNIHLTQDEVLSTLIKNGFLNELEWINSKGTKRENNYIFPKYLRNIADDIDKYIQIPEIQPDFNKLIDSLSERKRIEYLICLEDLLKKGWMEKSKLKMTIIPQPFIIGEEKNIFSINYCILPQVKEYFFKKKNGEIKFQNEIATFIDNISKQKYPDVYYEEIELFSGSQSWRLNISDKSESDKDILFIITPWLTISQLSTLKEKYQSSYIIILLTMIGIPQLNDMYKVSLNENLNEINCDWILLDYSTDEIYEKIIRSKPKLYDEIIKMIGETGIKITKGKEPIIELPKEDVLTNNQKKAFDLITNFEKEFREFIMAELKKVYSNKWWKTGVKEDIKQKCQTKLEDDKQKRNPISDIQYYMDFLDMYSLIVWKQNKKIFSRFFPDDKDKLRIKMNELYDIRNPIMHSRREITDDEISKIQLYIKDINFWRTNPQKEQEEQSLLSDKRTVEEMKSINGHDSAVSELQSNPLSFSDPLKIHMGESSEKTPIYWEPDETAEKSKMVSGNILITGGAGSGKTETLKSILFELNKRGYTCLALAFHPDLIVDGFDIKKITAISDFGINPLDFDSLDEEGGGLPIQIYNVVERLKVTYPTIGDIQEANLIDILEEAYRRKGITEDKLTWNNSCPNFKDIEEILNEKIAEKGDKELLRLKNKLSKIFKFNIFSKSETLDIEKIFNQSTILDLSKLPEDFLFLVSDTILRKVYKNLKLREPILFNAKGKERFRIFIAIDEAKILVPSRKDDSKAIINIYGTEARKFGVGFIVSSQLTEHFGNDVLGNMATKVALKPLKFEIARDNAKELSIDPSELMNIKKSGEGYIRFSNEDTKKIFINPYEERKKK